MPNLAFGAMAWASLREKYFRLFGIRNYILAPKFLVVLSILPSLVHVLVIKIVNQELSLLGSLPNWTFPPVAYGLLPDFLHWGKC